MKKIYKIALVSGMFLMSLYACKKEDFNLTPVNDVTAKEVYSTPEGYKNALAKLYAGYGLTSAQGSGGSDIGGLDAGFADFLRLFWTAQELTTDEAVCAWVSDTGVPELDNSTWGTENPFLRGLYSRSMIHITFINEFLRESTPEKLSERGISGADATNIQQYRAEARFLRAYQYWVLMDNFGNPPFVTEADAIGKVSPKQISRADLFKYVESELLAIEPELAAPRSEYARADKGADWALLARLYLNAEVYTGTPKYTEAVTYSSKVINGGYTLKSNYADLFNTSNTENNQETILAITYDGVRGTNFGGTTFLINSAISADMNPASFGVPAGGWNGNRTRQNLPALFPDTKGTLDKRGVFFGTKPEVTDIAVFTDGLAITKFKNVNAQGVPAPSLDGTFSSLDFPIFRLAEQYLIYGEAVSRGGAGGSTAQALTYVNALRTRAYGNASGNVNSISTNFFIDERARELYWEGHRRTDLVRYGRFTGGSYLWPWKGGEQSGKAIAETRNIYPIPAADLIANPNLVQNPGY